MKKKPLVPGYNADWAKEVGKEEFVKQMSAAYPDTDHAKWFDENIAPEKDKKK